MAIPQGRLSTEVVESAFIPPENRTSYALGAAEKGPIHIQDTSEGVNYQIWNLNWDPNTGDMTLSAETTGDTSVPLNIPVVTELSFCFDQNARISVCYKTPVSAYLYWYDSALGSTTTTDLGADIFSMALTLDDKRATQYNASDMMLWYTREQGGGLYSLYTKLQRERFLTEHLMKTDMDVGFLYKLGMNSRLRVQLSLRSHPRF